MLYVRASDATPKCALEVNGAGVLLSNLLTYLGANERACLNPSVDTLLLL